MDTSSNPQDPEPGRGSESEAISQSERETPPDQAAKPVAPRLVPLDLPKGALIAFRKRGGAQTSPHAVFVYPDGRVSYDAPDAATKAHQHVSRKLNDGQIAGLRKLLERGNFFGVKPAADTPSPDAPAWEIIARVGSRSNHIEIPDAAIPGSLQPLLQQLNALMPKE